MQGKRGNERRQGFDNFRYCQCLLHNKRNGEFDGKKLEEMQGRKEIGGRKAWEHCWSYYEHLLFKRRIFKNERKRGVEGLAMLHLLSTHFIQEKTKRRKKKEQQTRGKERKEEREEPIS